MSEHEDRPAVDVEALRKVAEAAPGGPWTWHEYHRRNDEPVPYMTGRGGDPATYAYDTEVIEPGHSGECGCRSACHLELRVSRETRDHIATFDPPTILALLAEHAALIAEVELLRGELALSERVGIASAQSHMLEANARTAVEAERNEAVERATKAEREVERLREDRLQMLAHTGRVVGQRDAARNERDEAQAVIADLRKLADQWDESKRPGMVGISDHLLALLPDETGHDRG